ncbi:MAG: magnesium chelatase subunit D [Rubrivivax sp.]|nr:magnesium chelatase subunit D [Rubrivivax sp.]
MTPPAEHPAWRAADLLALDGAGFGGLLWRGAGGVPEAWLARLQRALPAGAVLRRLPLHADDDRLLGGLDLAATLAAGRPVQQAGLLAQAAGGVLLLPMAERLPPRRAAQLAAALDDAAARLTLVAFDDGLGMPADGGEAVPASLAERLGLQLQGPLPQGRGAAPEPPDADLAAARLRWPRVQAGDEALAVLVQAAMALGIGSLRAPLMALRVARAAAALAGRDAVDEPDLALAAQLVLAPRATRLPAPPAEDDAPSEAPPPPPPAESEADEDDDRPPPDPAEVEALQEQVLQAALAAIPPGLLALLAVGSARGQGAGGKAGAWQSSPRRGRPVGSRRGDPRTGARLHLIDTLRAAAPWQAVRRREAAGGFDDAQRPPPRVHVTRGDLRIVRLRERRETTTVFVVDASGSAALHRLAEAKGAVELLLAECYVRRDRVALIAFRGRPQAAGAELLLPPTRSLVRAKRSLAELPGGGGTPLAAGLDAARVLAEDLQRRGGTPVVVLLSDGRANLARDGSPGRARAHEDALASARAWAPLGVQVLWLDTAPQPQPPAQEVARAMGARYLPLPHADAQQVAALVTRAR